MAAIDTTVYPGDSEAGAVADGDPEERAQRVCGRGGCTHEDTRTQVSTPPPPSGISASSGLRLYLS